MAVITREERSILVLPHPYCFRGRIIFHTIISNIFTKALLKAATRNVLFATMARSLGISCDAIRANELSRGGAA